jgi:glutathione S-transferase
MKQSKITIWGRDTSANVHKILWLCHAMNIEYDRIDLGGPFGGNRQPEYLAKNPNGLVPTIEDGSVILWESNAILRYLVNSRGGHETLYPSDAVARAKVEQWMDWQSASFGPMGVLLIGLYRTPPEQRNVTALEEARLKTLALFEIIEKQLTTNPYICGSDFTLADICLATLVYRWHRFPIKRPPLPRLALYNQRLGEHAEYRKFVDKAIV